MRTPTDRTPAVVSAQRRRAPFMIRVLKRPSGMISAVLLVLIVGACLGAGIWAPFDPIANDLSNSLAGPSATHLLGTDQLGRDVFSRLLFGGIPTFIAAAQVAVVAVGIAVPMGLIAGYVGGRTDAILMRVVDFGLAVPNMIFVLVIISIFGDQLDIAYFALGVLLVPSAARIIRGAAINVRGELYIDAARVSGVGTMTIVFRHVLPRVVGAILVQASLLTAVGIILTGGLAYLGFGPPPPEPSWGGLIGESLTVLNRNPWLLVGTGVAMGLTVLGLGLLGDAIRDETVEAWSAPPARPVKAPRNRRRSSQPAPALVPGALLRVNGLRITFERHGRPVPVAQDVSFELHRGQILGLVGESGCGKTSVARSILGLLRGTGQVAAGEIVFDGRRIDTMEHRELRALRGHRIALVSQEPMASLDPTQRVGHVIADKIRAGSGVSRAEAASRTINLFRLVQLRDPARVFDLYPHQISGGMAQRVAIARALAGEPDLLVADEPTTALDVTVQAEILDLLREIRDRTGMAILVVTHDWGVVAELCDSAIVMYAGQVVERAPVDQLTELPAHPYTRALLESNPSLAHADATRLPTIAGTIPPPEAWPVSCHFADRCPIATAECREGPIPVIAIEAGRTSRCIRTAELLGSHSAAPASSETKQVRS